MEIKDCCISSVEPETGGSLVLWIKMKDQTAFFLSKINQTGYFPFQHDKRKGFSVWEPMFLTNVRLLSAGVATSDSNKGPDRSNYVSLNSDSMQDRLENKSLAVKHPRGKSRPTYRWLWLCKHTVNRLGLMSSLLWAGKQVVAQLKRFNAICGNKSSRLVIKQRHKHWGLLRKAEF